MRVEVVDTSALAALYFDEAKADAVAERLGEARLLAPALIRFEMCSVALKKIARNPSVASLVLERLTAFLSSPLEICEVDHAAVVGLALTTKLTAYDASYLWLAKHRQCGLVTLDRQLADAAATVLST